MATKRGRLVREPDTGTRRQAWGTVTENSVRLNRNVAAELVTALSVDHAGSFNLFYLLRKHYWTAEGAEHEQVAAFLEAAYKRTRAINDDLAVRIVELGGIPPNTPPTIQEHAEVHLEAEDLYDLHASLEGDLAGYATLIGSLREHVGLAEAVGDPTTAQHLRSHLETVERDAADVERLLEGDTLVGATSPHTDRDGPNRRTAAPKESTAHLRTPDATHRRQEWDTVVDNALRLDETAAVELTTALNSDLAGLYILFNQVRKHFWTIEGAEWRQLDQFLRDAADRLTHVTDTLAIRVHALGGVPVCGPMGLRQHAPMYIETPHRYDVRSSLERDLEGYATLAAQFREHIDLATGHGDGATNELLSVHLETLEEAIQQLEQFLADDTFVRRP